MKVNCDNKNVLLRGFRVLEYVLKVGDLVVYICENGKGYDLIGYFFVYGELVIEKGNNYIKVIGGNVSNLVRIFIYKIDVNGKFLGNKVSFFMVI